MPQENAQVHQFDTERLLKDMEKGSAALEASFDAEINQRILQQLERECREGVIQFRIGSIANSPVNYRIGCLLDVDWVERIKETGLMPGQVANEQLMELLPALRKGFPASAYLGADFDAATGFQKIYLMFLKPVPLSEFLEVGSLPPALREQQGRLEGHGMNEVTIAAVDYVKGSVNVYFVWRDPSEAWLDRFADEWGHGPIAAETKREILRSTPIHGSVATTWSYGKSVPKRWCVYAIGLRYDDPSVYREGGELAGYELPALHQRFQRFDEHAGTQTDRIAYGLGWSFGEPCQYLKYERSYTSDLAKFYKAQTDSFAE